MWLLTLTLNACAYFALSWVWPRHPQQSVQERTIVALLWSLFFTCFSAMRWFKKQTQTDLLVADRKITLRQCKSGQYKVVASVHEGLIQTIHQRRRSLFLSDKSPYVSFLFKGVEIPTALPDYERLKDLALSWRHKRRT